MKGLESRFLLASPPDATLGRPILLLGARGLLQCSAPGSSHQDYPLLNQPWFGKQSVALRSLIAANQVSKIFLLLLPVYSISISLALPG